MLASSLPLRTLSRLGDWVAEERALLRPFWPMNLVLIAAFLISPVPIVALITQEVTVFFWAAMISDLLLLFVFAVVTLRQPALLIGVIVLWFALQRLVIALIAPHVSADVVRLLLTYKEGFYLILLAAAGLTVALRQLRGERAIPPVLAADAIAFAFLGLLAIHFLTSPGTSSPELTYLRRFAAPVILYFGGRLLIPRAAQLREGLRLVALVAAGVALFGLVERFVLDIAFWRDNVDATTFYSKQVESGLLAPNWTVIYHGVPDGIFIALPLEVPVRRLVSTYLEPTTLGSFLAFALILLLLASDLGTRFGRPYRIAAGIGIILLTLAVVATLSRGAMLTAAAAIALFYLARIAQSNWRLSNLPPLVPTLALMTVLGLGIALTTFSDVPAGDQVRDVLSTRAVSGLSAEPAASTIPPRGDPTAPLQQIDVHPPGSTAEGASKHLGGLRSGLNHMLHHPLGSGLGTAGDWSDDREVGHESTVGALAAQLGVPGFLLFLTFFASVIASLIAAAWRDIGHRSNVTLALAGGLFGLFLVSWISESVSGLLGNAPYFLFAGWALALASPATDRARFQWVPDAEDSTSTP